MAEGGDPDVVVPSLERAETSGETCPIPEEKVESTVEPATRDSKREERLQRLRELHMRRVKINYLFNIIAETLDPRGIGRPLNGPPPHLGP